MIHHKISCFNYNMHYFITGDDKFFNIYDYNNSDNLYYIIKNWIVLFHVNKYNLEYDWIIYKIMFITSYPNDMFFFDSTNNEDRGDIQLQRIDKIVRRLNFSKMYKEIAYKKFVCYTNVIKNIVTKYQKSIEYS